MATAATTTMGTKADNRSLIRLMTWLSPAFPVGAFAYSGGLERAVHDGLIGDSAALATWIEAAMTCGTWRNDAILLAEAWHGHDDPGRLDDVIELASALAGSAERHLEILMQGEAFVAAAAAWPHPLLARLGQRPPYGIAVGAVAAAHGVPLESTLSAYLHALASQAVSSAIRLGVLGQKQGVDLLAALEIPVIRAAEAAASAGLDDLGSAIMIGDIAAIRHESQYSRLFRS